MPRSGGDIVLGLALVAMYVAQIYYKIVTHTCLFMLQPCHLLCLSSLIMCLFPRAWAAPLVNAQLPWMMGAWAAILMPDTDELKQPYEVKFFFLEHALVFSFSPLLLPLLCASSKLVLSLPQIAFAPLYLLLRNNGAALRTTRVFSSVLGAWTMFIYHCALAQPVGLAVKVNLNYMLCPTDSLTALIFAVFPAKYVWPTYHTPVYIAVPILSQLLHSLYLGVGSLVMAARRLLPACCYLACAAPSKPKTN